MGSTRHYWKSRRFLKAASTNPFAEGALKPICNQALPCFPRVRQAAEIQQQSLPVPADPSGAPSPHPRIRHRCQLAPEIFCHLTEGAVASGDSSPQAWLQRGLWLHNKGLRTNLKRFALPL